MHSPHAIPTFHQAMRACLCCRGDHFAPPTSRSPHDPHDRT